MRSARSSPELFTVIAWPLVLLLRMAMLPPLALALPAALSETFTWLLMTTLPFGAHALAWLT